MNTKDRSKIGRKSRRDGANFELKVRKELEEKGWIVAKWTNNVEIGFEVTNDLEKVDVDKNIIYDEDKDAPLGLFGRLVPCKNKFNPFTKRLMMASGGFPDFSITRVAFDYSKPDLSMGIKGINIVDILNGDYSVTAKVETRLVYENIGVECKTSNYLDKEEREKCRWLLENNIFSRILIASKDGKCIRYCNFDVYEIEKKFKGKKSK